MVCQRDFHYLCMTLCVDTQCIMLFFYHPPTFVDIFNVLNIDKKWQIWDHLLLSTLFLNWFLYRLREVAKNFQMTYWKIVKPRIVRELRLRLKMGITYGTVIIQKFIRKLSSSWFTTFFFNGRKLRIVGKFGFEIYNVFFQQRRSRIVDNFLHL